MIFLIEHCGHKATGINLPKGMTEAENLRH